MRRFRPGIGSAAPLARPVLPPVLALVAMAAAALSGVCVPAGVDAVAYTSRLPGLWSSPSMWTPTGVPGAGDTATVLHTALIDDPNGVTVSALTVSGLQPSSGVSFFVSASLTVTGDCRLTSGMISLAGTLSVGGAFVMTGGQLNGQSFAVVLSSPTVHTLTAGTLAFTSGTLFLTSATATLSLPSTAAGFTVQGGTLIAQSLTLMGTLTLFSTRFAAFTALNGGQLVLRQATVARLPVSAAAVTTPIVVAGSSSGVSVFELLDAVYPVTLTNWTTGSVRLICFSTVQFMTFNVLSYTAGSGSRLLTAGSGGCEPTGTITMSPGAQIASDAGSDEQQ